MPFLSASQRAISHPGRIGQLPRRNLVLYGVVALTVVAAIGVSVAVLRDDGGDNFCQGVGLEARSTGPTPEAAMRAFMIDNGLEPKPGRIAKRYEGFVQFEPGSGQGFGGFDWDTLNVRRDADGKWRVTGGCVE